MINSVWNNRGRRKSMAVYCMSDIHGHLKQLQECLSRVQFRPGEDELYLLGDYIDWGPDSMDVLQFVMFLQKNYPRHIHCLMGNHEDLMLQTLVNFRMDIADVWLNGNRGDHTLAQYQMLSEQEKLRVLTFLKNLSYGAEVECEGKRYLLAHAYPYFPDPGKDQRLIHHMALWKRLQYDDNPFEKMLELYPERKGEHFDKFIFGHTLTSGFFEDQLVKEKLHGKRPKIAETDYAAYRAALGTNVVFANEYMINIDCGGKCIGLWNDTNRKLRMEAEYARLAILRLNDRAVFYSEPERPAELQKECQI